MGYIDPNLFGILSQIGLTILLVLGVILSFFRSSVMRLLGISKKDKKTHEPVEDPKNDN